MKIQIGHDDNEPIDKNRNKKAMLVWLLIISGLAIQTSPTIEWWISLIPITLGILILLINLYGIKIIQTNKTQR
jgi:hypothetical protein